MKIIQTDKELQELCGAIMSQDFICIDTEFERSKTYFSKLCLVQIGFDEEVFLVDPFMEQLDIAALLNTICEFEGEVILHSAQQDLEIIYDTVAKLPKNVFDTQIAAAFLGYGGSIAYNSIVEKILDIKVDKSARFTHWFKRPLTDRQLEYAAKDVEYLPAIYKVLKADLEKQNRYEWFRAEVKEAFPEEDFTFDEEYFLSNIKFRNGGENSIRIYMALSIWREKMAREKNLPRTWVLKDDLMSQLSMQRPKNEERAKELRGFNSLNKGFADNVIEIINDKSTWPEYNLKKTSLRPKEKNQLVSLAQILLKINAKNMGVAAKFIATNNEISNYLAGEKTKFDHGWRYQTFGQKLDDLLAGKLVATIENGEVKFIEN